MTIKVGDKLPAATFKVKTADGVKEMTTDEVFKGKKSFSLRYRAPLRRRAASTICRAISITATQSSPRAWIRSPLLR